MAGNEKHKSTGVTMNTNNDNTKDINKINSLKSKKNERGNSVERSQLEHVKFDRPYDGTSNNVSNDRLPPIPDGGWGWVVVFASFLASACADGMGYSFGILHEEFVNYFEASQSRTSLIGSLFISIPLISGPVMSTLVDRFGCKVTTMVAGVIATGGFLLASLSNSVEMLCVTLGVISGFAMGILYVTSVVSVAFWFDKRRAFAVSLASCGTGFGTIFYSSLTDFFLGLYDWRNTLVLLGATVINMCVCGALMRDPDWLIIKEKTEKKLTKINPRKASIAASSSSHTNFLNDLLKSGKSPKYILATLMTSLAAAEQLKMKMQMETEQSGSNPQLNNASDNNTYSDIHVPTVFKQNEKEPDKIIERLLRKQSLYNALVQNYPDVMYQRKSLFDQDVPPVHDNALTKKWYERAIDSFESLSKFKIFAEFHFLMFILASIMIFCWAIIPYFYLKSYMTSRGIEEGALMINIIGISNSIGIVALGWAGDQPWINVSKVYAVCLFICGLSVAAYPLFITNFWAVTAISTVFGLSYASTYSYTPVILMELMPLDYFTISYGFILLGQGLGHLCGPPLGGLIYDLTKSWDLVFYVGGVWLGISGVCVGIIPYTKNFCLCSSRPTLKDVVEANSKSFANV